MPRIPRVGTLSGEFYLGSYGVLGGQVELFGNWEPNVDSPLEVSYDMLQLAGYLENTEVPLTTAAVIAEQDTQKRFETETDPDGTPWAPLDPDYLAHKVGEGYPENILIRTDEMREAATRPGTWRVTSDTLFFDPSALPFYAPLHQEGTDTEGRAGEAFRHRETIRAFRSSGLGIPAERKGESQHGDLGIGRGKALPARPFIGLSEEAINEIAFTFDLWFDQGVQDIFVHPHTGRAQRWQFKGGRRLFGPGV